MERGSLNSFLRWAWPLACMGVVAACSDDTEISLNGTQAGAAGSAAGDGATGGAGGSSAEAGRGGGAGAGGTSGTGTDVGGAAGSMGGSAGSRDGIGGATGAVPDAGTAGVGAGGVGAGGIQTRPDAGQDASPGADGEDADVGGGGLGQGGQPEPDAGANVAPSVSEVRYAAAANTSLQVDTERGLLRRAEDVNGDVLRVSVAGASNTAIPAVGSVAVETPLGGVLSLSADGSFGYEPPLGTTTGLDVVGFSVEDGRGGSASAQVAIGITPGVLDAQPGFEIQSGGNVFLTGYSSGGIGDFNADGFDDVIVMARGNPGGAGERDLGYITLGSEQPGNVNLSLGGGDVLILAESVGLDDFGVAVSPAGRVNDDDIDDFVIGVHEEPIAPGTQNLLGGKAYVIFGTATPPAEIDLATLEAEQRGFMIIGAAGQDHLGFSVSGAGNVNGVGGDDVVLGAIGRFPEAGESPTDGKAYVVFGKNDFSPVDLASLGNSGFRINGEPGVSGEAGVAVTDIGDWNNDGMADVAVSATKIANASGRVYVVYGKATTTDVELFDVASGSGGFAIDGTGQNTQAGRTLQKGGDLGGSALPDLLIGVPNPPGVGAVGRTVVLYGKPDTASVDLADVDGNTSLGFVVLAEESGDRSGFGLAGPGDFNGDGFDDLVIGAHDNSATLDGAVHLLLGLSSPSNTIDLATLDPGVGFSLRGPTGSQLGFAVFPAGDLNGDDFPDVIVGAPQQSGSDGSAYVLLGHP